MTKFDRLAWIGMGRGNLVKPCEAAPSQIFLFCYLKLSALTSPEKPAFVALKREMHSSTYRA